MSHPVGAGAGGPAGAHPLNDAEHRRRRGGWWWWLLALLALLLAALIIVLLARHFGSSDTKTAAKKAAPAVAASPPSSVPATPASTSASQSSPASRATTSSGSGLPTTDCETPSLTATSMTVDAGQRVTVVGRHFSGCHAVSGNAVPAATLPVSIRVAGSDVIAKALATVRTNTKGSFTVAVTIPASTGRRVTLLAASHDVRTTRAYAGAATIVRTSSPIGSGGRPTAVPAGTGGAAASTTDADVETQYALLAVGLLLAAGGSTALLRRRITR